MKEYKQILKLRVLSAFNLYNDELVKPDHDEFDIEIAYCASRNCSDTELMAFYYMFKCEDTYEDALNKLNQCCDKEYSIETFKTYSKRAIMRIVEVCHKDEKLSGYVTWHKNKAKMKHGRKA